MSYIFQIFLVLLSCLVSYILGNRTFMKDNLKIQVDNFFYPIKNNFDSYLLMKSYEDNNEFLIEYIGDCIYNYEKLTPFLKNDELEIFIELSNLLNKPNSDNDKIITLYMSFISLVRVRYNKITKLYFFPKWVE